MVAVTHDRVFLDRVTTTVLEVDHDARTVRRYGNGYGGFLTAKAAARARWARQHEEWRAEVARHSALAESNTALLSAIRARPRPPSAAPAPSAPGRARTAR